MEDTDRTLTRVEAAAYLTEKGRNTKVSTLAKYADGRGPPFFKEGLHVAYKQSDLDAWLAQPVGQAGRPAAPKGELLDTLREFLPMVDQLMSGRGTFADGMRFGALFSELKRLTRRRGNGAD